MIVTAGNPLEDLRALRDLEMIVARGSIIDHPKIKKRKQVEAEMTEAYGSSFKNKLTEERLFKKVYRAYLAELKYFVKTNQKKGDNKE